MLLNMNFLPKQNQYGLLLAYSTHQQWWMKEYLFCYCGLHDSYFEKTLIMYDIPILIL